MEHNQQEDPLGEFVGELLDETEAMARHALEHGMVVPPDLVTALQNVRWRMQLHLTVRSPAMAAANAPATQSIVPPNTQQQALLLKRGEEIEEIVGSLAELHQRLARLVSPATPRALLIIAQNRKTPSRLRWLSEVPLLRNMMVIAVAFLLGLLLLSTAPTIDAKNIAKGFLDNAGFVQLLCQGFLLCAAGLGSCFATLFQVGRYLEAGTYDTRYDTLYWSRLLLGLMAGIVLAELVGAQFVHGGGVGESPASESAAFAKPMLALLGGFSASVVNRILERLVQSVDSLVAGQADSTIAAKSEALNARLQAELAEEKMRLAKKLEGLTGANDAQKLAANQEQPTAPDATLSAPTDQSNANPTLA